MSTNPTVHQYEGDNALWCHIGEHTYDTDQCRYCDRELPTDTTIVIRYPYQTKGGPLAANE